MVQWGDLFWGDGNRSFEILSSNVKNGAIAIEEFQRFINESAQYESSYCKNLSRLQTQLTKVQHVGTFTPVWILIRDLLDKISSAHSSTLNFYQELLRDIHNYQDIYHKKVKAHIQKDNDINRTVDLISHLNNSLSTVNKAKEQYHSSGTDYERAKRVGNNMLNSSSVSSSQDSTNAPSLAQSALNSITSRQIDRLEKKHRQAQDEYKTTIDKYNNVRNDYEKRFYDACTKFQDFEINHIEKMLVFSLNYSELLQKTSEQVRIAETEFNEKLKSLTGHDLLNLFAEQKKTGIDRPTVLQFEEIDNLKAPMQLNNANISDLTLSQDDINTFDQFESGVPSFQAHFSVSSPPVKNHDANRALSPTASQPAVNNLPSTPPSTSTHPSAANNMMTRSVDSTTSNDQTSNPFDLKIRKPKFPGFFGSVRKDKKDKKNDKKILSNKKPMNTSQTQQSRDEPPAVNTNSEINDFITITENNDDYASISFNKSPTPEVNPRSTPSISISDNRNTNSFLSSKTSKSSSSSDSSDDEDDNPMLKIDFKIKPKTEPSVEGDDNAKIMNAMRLIDKNISRGTPIKPLDMNKSISSGQIGTRPLPPPPIPSRPPTTIPNNVTTELFDQSSAFPSNDDFNQLPSDATKQDNLLFPTDDKNTTSISSTEDDTEVANSFPNDNKTSLFPVLQLPPSLQAHHQHSKLTSISPTFTSIPSSPIITNEYKQSPLTIGATDQVPLAIAFQESIDVTMSGNDQKNWQSRILGQMLISFPASFLNLLVDASRYPNTLEFRLKNLDNIENITENPLLITHNESVYSFNMAELNTFLRNLQEKTPTSRFFNLNVINYEVKQSNTSNIPIEISSQWTRTFDTISVNINYRFNSSNLPESIRLNNDTVIFYTIITEGQQIKESSPTAEWSPNDHKLWWKVPYVDNGTGTLSSIISTEPAEKIENDNDQQQDQPLTTSSIVNASFVGENALFSSIDFELVSRGYRISLLKKKILSGKYQSEPDHSEPIHLFRRPTISPLTTS